MSSNCKYYAPAQPCNGHGVCLNDGICQCEEGWTSIGDFSTTFGDHCGINLIAIRILWIVAVIPCLLLLFTASQLIKIKLDKTKAGENVNSHMKNKVLMSWDDPAAIFPVCFFVDSIFALLTGIMKAINSEKFAISLHPATTAFFVLFIAFRMIGMSVYLQVLIKFMDGYAKMMPSKAGAAMKRQGAIVNFAAKIAVILIIPVCCFIPLINVIYPNHDIECMIGFSAGCIFIVIYISCFALRYLSIISKEIGKHLEEKRSDAARNPRDFEKFEEAKNKIDGSRTIKGFAALSIVIVHSLYIFWPLLIKNSSYFFPLLVFGTTMNCNKTCKTFVNSPKKGSSTDSRLASANLNKIDPSISGMNSSESNKFVQQSLKEMAPVSRQISTDVANISSARVFASDNDHTAT